MLSRKWISTLCAYFPSLGGLPPPRSSRSPELRPLRCTAAPLQPPALHVVAYTCQRHSPSSALTRAHGLFSSTVPMLALRVGSSRPCFCHVQMSQQLWGWLFGSGFFCFLFLSFRIHAGLLYWDSKGLNGAFNCRSVYRGELLS